MGFQDFGISGFWDFEIKEFRDFVTLGISGHPLFPVIFIKAQKFSLIVCLSIRLKNDSAFHLILNFSMIFTAVANRYTVMFLSSQVRVIKKEHEIENFN